MLGKSSVFFLPLACLSAPGLLWWASGSCLSLLLLDDNLRSAYTTCAVDSVCQVLNKLCNERYIFKMICQKLTRNGHANL